MSLPQTIRCLGVELTHRPSDNAAGIYSAEWGARLQPCVIDMGPMWSASVFVCGQHHRESASDPETAGHKLEERVTREAQTVAQLLAWVAGNGDACLERERARLKALAHLQEIK